jgi:ATP-dependent Clp protease, protease subunit
MKTAYMCGEKPNKTKKDDKSGDISVSNNHIYFYSDITSDSILDLRKEIDAVSLEQKTLKLSYPKHEPIIYLHINSGGGYVTDGLNAMDMIMNNDVPIETIVEGMSASASTLLSIAGKHRKIQKNSFILIHQISSIMWGKQSDLEDEVENIKLYESKILDFYEKHSNLKKKELKEIMKNEKFIDSAEALRCGFVDEII